MRPFGGGQGWARRCPRKWGSIAALAVGSRGRPGAQQRQYLRGRGCAVWGRPNGCKTGAEVGRDGVGPLLPAFIRTRPWRRMKELAEYGVDAA
ncbi:hypothetical protein NDU88_004721 [Pleurodeles waltl]|uniref:Uncharacterized protein n=1 Tax=Pleurodeles waltl TaxID=8319 RepID=A0AAV7PKM2_PLEWA|nr:hypothetical protein NDU88_004721 [Pleurodeles waltl]